jgi:hypothetical protein
MMQTAGTPMTPRRSCSDNSILPRAGDLLIDALMGTRLIEELTIFTDDAAMLILKIRMGSKHSRRTLKMNLADAWVTPPGQRWLE